MPVRFATTWPFLIIHFLLFTVIAVIYGHKQANQASAYVDATLVFGKPYEWVSLFTNSIVQMAFTFLWGIITFILMLLAH